MEMLEMDLPHKERGYRNDDNLFSFIFPALYLQCFLISSSTLGSPSSFALANLHKPLFLLQLNLANS